MIDNIQYNVNVAAEFLERGNDDLVKTIESKNSNRKVSYSIEIL